jgi:hypothetical protein
MDAAHPTYPHWYLPWFGVDSVKQGKGTGGKLMERCLVETADADHLPAYLETPNPRSISFYERHGFKATGSAPVGGCPPITFMPRSACFVRSVDLQTEPNRQAQRLRWLVYPLWVSKYAGTVE